MAYRIYIDESGTHADQWLVIGVLFVPDHGVLHAALCKAKEDLSYLNTSPKKSARYKETHLSEFRSSRDVDLGKKWIDIFVQHSCFYRAVVIDWGIWDGCYFGGPFEPEALKRRRAYKKWLEMLLHPEFKEPRDGVPISSAKLYLDRLKVLYGYDIVPQIYDRFTRNYEGASPYVESFQHTDSWRDANQCLQLCDLLTGCLYQNLAPATKIEKLAVRDHLAIALKPFGVQRMAPGFWRQYAKNTLTKHFPKFSAWFWRPEA